MAPSPAPQKKDWSSSSEDVFRALHNADGVAPDSDRNWNHALVELNRDLFLPGIDTFYNRLFTLERPGDDLDYGPLGDAADNRLWHQEVFHLGKRG